MMKQILGISADLIGVLFVWCPLDALMWQWKLIISLVVLAVAVGGSFFTRDPREAKVKNYCWDENGSITLILNKNKFYATDMLVGIYTKDDNHKVLCAIGYVKTDPDEKMLHVQVVHQTDKAKMEYIRSSAKQYKKYSIKPNVTHSDVIKIHWK